MPKQEKVEAVASIKKLFEDSGSFFITDYQGLNVADMTVLRRNLRENNVRYLVAKNTLLRLAARGAGREGFDEFFRGPTAVAFSADDPSIAAKILHDSYKAKELPRIKVFVVDDHTHQSDEIERLASLPPKPVLLSQLVSAIESPIAQLAGALDGFFRELIGSLDALAEKKKNEG